MAASVLAIPAMAQRAKPRTVLKASRSQDPRVSLPDDLWDMER